MPPPQKRINVQMCPDPKVLFTSVHLKGFKTRPGNLQQMFNGSTSMLDYTIYLIIFCRPKAKKLGHLCSTKYPFIYKTTQLIVTSAQKARSFMLSKIPFYLQNDTTYRKLCTTFKDVERFSSSSVRRRRRDFRIPRIRINWKFNPVVNSIKLFQTEIQISQKLRN